MTIQTYCVRDTDYPGNDIASLPVKPQMSAAELQASFDRLVKRVIAPKLNALIEALTAATGGDEIGKTVSGMTGTTVGALLEELYAGKASAKDAALTGIPTAPTPDSTANNAQIATAAFVRSVVADAVFATGAADMTKAVYDTQNRAEDVFAYAERMATMRQAELTLPVAGWSQQTDGTWQQTLSVEGLQAVGRSYLVSPAPAAFSAFGACGICMLDVEEDGEAVFTAANLPDAAVTVYLLEIRTTSFEG